jgi:hypothetical protein
VRYAAFSRTIWNIFWVKVLGLNSRGGTHFFWKTANLFLTFVQLCHTILMLASDSSLMAGPISLYSHSSATSLAAMFYDTVELKWHYSTVISSCVLYTHPWLTLASHILLWPIELAIDLCVASLCLFFYSGLPCCWYPISRDWCIWTFCFQALCGKKDTACPL